MLRFKLQATWTLKCANLNNTRKTKREIEENASTVKRLDVKL